MPGPTDPGARRLRWGALFAVVLLLAEGLVALPAASAGAERGGAGPAPGVPSGTTCAGDRFSACLDDALPLGPAARPAAGADLWYNVSSTQLFSPPPLVGAGLAWDAVDNYLVLFGGCAPGQCPAPAQTWKYSGGYWTNITAAPQPPARAFASLVLDSRDGYLLLFGGQGVGGVALNDTWTFSGGAWTNVTNASLAPPARWAASAVFDRYGNQVVVFGGCGPTACPRDDTWRYVTGVWKNLTGGAGYPPRSRVGAAFAWDSGDSEGILFGGCGTTCPYGDTWAFLKGKWSQLYPSNPPPARSFASLTYLGQENETLLSGGNGTLGPIQDTWKYTGARWTNLTVTVGPGPSPRFGVASLESTMAWTSLGAKHLTYSVDFGGSNATCFNCTPGALDDTWVFELPLTATPTSLPSLVEVGEPVSFTAVALGGTGPYVYLWQFGDQTSLFTQSPTHAYGGPGVFTANVTAADLAGVSVSAQVTVTVLPGPAVGMGVQPLATDVGLPVSFTGTASGGTPPYSVLWSFGDMVASTSLGASHAYGAAGNYTVSLRISDAVEGYGIRWANVTVHPLPEVDAVLSTLTPDAGTNVTFAASVNGGTAPFTYDWVFGDGNASATASGQHAYGATGTFRGSISVVDSVGASSRFNFTVLVQAPPSNGTGGDAGPPLGVPVAAWLAFGAAAVIAVAAAIMILRRRRPPPTSLAAAPVEQSDWRDEDPSGSPTSSRSMRRSVDRFYRRRI